MEDKKEISNELTNELTNINGKTKNSAIDIDD